MAPMYYRRANAAIIVYDVTRESTFEEAKEWVKGQFQYLIQTFFQREAKWRDIVTQKWRLNKLRGPCVLQACEG